MFRADPLNPAFRSRMNQLTVDDLTRLIRSIALGKLEVDAKKTLAILEKCRDDLNAVTAEVRR